MIHPDRPTTLQYLDPSLIDVDPNQPRQDIDPTEQAELEASVRAHGGIQTPIMVLAVAHGRYQVVYGERRLRAAQVLGLSQLPCLVSRADPTEWSTVLDVQLIENLCRSALRPLELAQGLWRRIVGEQIAALEREQTIDPQETAQLLANALTPAGQIAILEDRLCALAGVPTVAAYFGGGRVRVPRKQILERYGMADWNESRLKKLFQTLNVDPIVQDMLVGLDVSARTLRELRNHPPERQVELVNQAKQHEPAQVNSVLSDLLEESAHTPHAENDEPDTLAVPSPAQSTFEPDPTLALLTSTGGSAPKLVTDQVAPARGKTPPTGKRGGWDVDLVLQLESALETAQTIIGDGGEHPLTGVQRERLQQRWGMLVEQMNAVLLREES
jgi:ParB-like nuclease domain